MRLAAPRTMFDLSLSIYRAGRRDGRAIIGAPLGAAQSQLRLVLLLPLQWLGLGLGLGLGSGLGIRLVLLLPLQWHPPRPPTLTTTPTLAPTLILTLAPILHQACKVMLSLALTRHPILQRPAPPLVHGPACARADRGWGRSR